jgi:hypothetical protein
VYAARRPLLTAIAAGALLAALWFIPTAHATAGRLAPAADARPGDPAVIQASTGGAPGSGAATLSDSGEAAAPTGAGGGRLADTGGARTTLHLLGGTVLLGLGAGFVTFAMRRGHSA